MILFSFWCSRKEGYKVNRDKNNPVGVIDVDKDPPANDGIKLPCVNVTVLYYADDGPMFIFFYHLLFRGDGD